jgi:nicotinamidase-related amidase/type 1 glutamine amidotransferase
MSSASSKLFRDHVRPCGSGDRESACLGPRALPAFAIAFGILAASLLVAAAMARADDEPASEFSLVLRSRSLDALDGSDALVESQQTWAASATAVIVCDMWDLHHCKHAARRVEELAPRVDRFLDAARERGAFIIHAPSSCMAAYATHPARERARSVLESESLPAEIGAWCYSIPAEGKGIYPLDQSDGGCDTPPREQAEFLQWLADQGRVPGSPWLRQIEAIGIDAERDAISDSGEEIWSLLEERGIDSVILVGVHTNMCVLGRPFGLRQMAKNGKRVVLCRDLTDTMYNPGRWPFVHHFRGNELIVEHIEKYVCPTITSDQLLGGEAFRFRDDVRPRIVVAIAEPIYDTRSTLATHAKSRWGEEFGFDVEVVIGEPETHALEGLAKALEAADVLVLSMRRQALEPRDLAAIQAHLRAGRGLLALRTSSHAFDARGGGPEGRAEWPEFDAEVLGGSYHGHHPDGPVATIRRGASEHPILTGLPASFSSPGSLYQTSPIAKDAVILLEGAIDGAAAEPVAWAREYGSNRARVVYTSLGHRGDFLRESSESDPAALPRFLDNALRWVLRQPVPQRIEDFRAGWETVAVPAYWKDVAQGVLDSHDGFAWYRCAVRVPEGWNDEDATIVLGKIDDCDETYINGIKVGATGTLPPESVERQSAETREYAVKAGTLRVGAWNVIAVRVFDAEGAGGIWQGEPELRSNRGRVGLRGSWELRVGDDAKWADSAPEEISARARFE